MRSRPGGLIELIDPSGDGVPRLFHSLIVSPDPKYHRSTLISNFVNMDKGSKLLCNRLVVVALKDKLVADPESGFWPFSLTPSMFSIIFDVYKQIWRWRTWLRVDNFASGIRPILLLWRDVRFALY